jgi:hypothetical protein
MGVLWRAILSIKRCMRAVINLTQFRGRFGVNSPD